MQRLHDARTAEGRHVKCYLRSPNPWAGKTLLLDLDKTLILCKDQDTHPKLHLVNEGARLILPVLRKARATAVITTAASRDYAHEMTAAAGLKVDRIFSRGDMLYVRDDQIRFLPKNYRGVLDEIREESPHANCAVIGDDIARDVPVEPQGIVTVIAGMETNFGRITAFLRTMLQLGGGNFADGFDRLRDGMKRRLQNVRVIRCADWHFCDDVYGMARIVQFRRPEQHETA